MGDGGNVKTESIYLDFEIRSAVHPVGVQCKLKGPTRKLLKKEVRDEVSKALTFKPDLREYVIATTAQDDTDTQRVARELTIEITNSGRQIAINVWGWNTLEQRISEHGPAMQAFDPSYGPFAKQHAEELQRVEEQQAVAIRELSDIRREIGGIVGGNNLPGGSTVAQNALELALDAEVDRYRDILNGGKPKTALGLYEALLSKVQDTASGRILFRIKANIGHCYFGLGDNSRAAHWLSDAFANAPNEPKAIANKALSMLLLDKYREAYDYGSNELQQDPTNQWLVPTLIQASARCTEIEDPISIIPKALRDLQDV